MDGIAGIAYESGVELDGPSLIFHHNKDTTHAAIDKKSTKNRDFLEVFGFGSLRRCSWVKRRSNA
jgi:hypothetical protein